MAKSRHSPSQQRRIDEYEKELRRLKNRVKYAQKKGYFFETSPIPETPKRITEKTIEKLRELKYFELSKLATFYITPEGEALEPKYGRIRQLKERTERQIISSYQNLAKAQVNRRVSKAKKQYLDRSTQTLKETGRRIPIFEKGYDVSQIQGKTYVDIYYSLLGAQGEDIAQSYLDTLSAEEYENFIDAYNIYSKKEGEKRVEQARARSEAKRRKISQTYEPISQDEGRQFSESYEDDGYSIDSSSDSGSYEQIKSPDESARDETNSYDESEKEYRDWDRYEYDEAEEQEDLDDYIRRLRKLWDEQGYLFEDDDINQAAELFKKDREKAWRRLEREEESLEEAKIKEDIERRAEAERKAKEDEGVRKWREAYEKQKHLPKNKRTYVHDGDAIYDGIIFRLRQFDYEMNDPIFRSKHPLNPAYVDAFKKLLERTIQTDGLETVLRRLDGNGVIIDNAIEEICWKASDEAALNMAFNELAEIIKGKPLTPEESSFYSSYSEFFGDNVEDLEGEIEGVEDDE